MGEIILNGPTGDFIIAESFSFLFHPLRFFGSELSILSGLEAETLLRHLCTYDQFNTERLKNFVSNDIMLCQKSGDAIIEDTANKLVLGNLKIIRIYDIIPESPSLYNYINNIVRSYNEQLKPTIKLDPEWIRAMIEQEAPESYPDARKYDPMQVANQGDTALSVLREGKEHTDLITSKKIA